MFVYVITAPINRVFYCCVKSRDNNHRGSKGTLECLWSEISHHNSLAHTQRAIALYLFFTSPFFLGDPIPTGSENVCELRKKRKKENLLSALVFHMLGTQRSIIIFMSLAFHRRPLSVRTCGAKGLSVLAEGLRACCFPSLVQWRVCFRAHFHLSSKVHRNLNQQSLQPSCAIKFLHTSTVIPPCVSFPGRAALLPHLIFWVHTCFIQHL